MALVEEFKGIPMAELIGGPLAAASAAQYDLAVLLVTFINQIGFEDGKTRTIDFDLERPVDDGSGVISKETVHIQAPLLGLVPIPALLIETVNIDFTMEVKQSTSNLSSSDFSLETSVSGGWGPVRASVTGKASTHRENTRSTDNSAKYVVNVVARQQPPTEGMGKMMDLLASAVEPISISASSS